MHLSISEKPRLDSYPITYRPSLDSWKHVWQRRKITHLYRISTLQRWSLIPLTHSRTVWQPFVGADMLAVEKKARNNCIWRQFSLIGQPVIVIALNSSLAGPQCGASGLWRELMNMLLSSSCREHLGLKMPLISETIVTLYTRSWQFSLTVIWWWRHHCL